MKIKRVERRKRKISFEALFFSFQLSIIKNRKKYPWTRPSHFHRSINCQITKKKKKKKQTKPRTRNILLLFYLSKNLLLHFFVTLSIERGVYSYLINNNTTREREREGKRGKEREKTHHRCSRFCHPDCKHEYC